jgi:phytoene synthase
MTPDEYCQHKTRQSGSSFYYSFLFLDKTQHQAMTALYAFCREVDDIVDKCLDPMVAERKLQWWREEIEQLFFGRPEHPVSLALKQSLKHYPLQQHYFLELLDGMHMDLHKNSYSNFDELSVYCYRAASVVGLLSIEIFGYQHDSTRQYAHNLGIALQLINILRDVREDAKHGRIYIPHDELTRFNVSKEMLINGQENKQTRALFAYQAQRARQYYQQAFETLVQEDRYDQRVGIIMAEIYFALLDKIVKLNYPVLEQRVKLAKLKKLWIAWHCAHREFKKGKR